MKPIKLAMSVLVIALMCGCSYEYSELKDIDDPKTTINHIVEYSYDGYEGEFLQEMGYPDTWSLLEDLYGTPYYAQDVAALFEIANHAGYYPSIFFGSYVSVNHVIHATNGACVESASPGDIYMVGYFCSYEDMISDSYVQKHYSVCECCER